MDRWEPSKQKPESVREEWDFRASLKEYDQKKYGVYEFLPADEVYYCHRYEFERHRADVEPTLKHRESCEKWREWKRAQERVLTAKEREQLANETFTALLEHHQATQPDKIVFVNWFYMTWPEWPASPFLSIPAQIRAGRYEACWGQAGGYPLPLVRLADIYKDIAELKGGKRPRRLHFWGNSEVALNPDTWVIRSILAPAPAPVEIAAFEIDYSLSDPILVQQFRNYLSRRRNQKGYKAHENCGASESDRQRSELNSLGAWRLIQSGMTYGEGAQHTQRVSGAPLYRDEETWGRNVHRGALLLGIIRRTKGSHQT